MSRVYRATVLCHYTDGTLAQPGLHYQTDVATLGDEPAPNDVADAIWSHIGGTFPYAIPSSCHMDSLVVSEQVLTPDIGVQGVHTINADGVAAAGTANEPKGLVPILNIRTGTRSRSARGYMVLPGPVNSDKLNAGKWSASYLVDLNSLAGLLKDVLTLGSLIPSHLNPVVYSRTRHQRAEDPYTFRVTQVTANATPHWRRSRQTSP